MPKTGHMHCKECGYHSSDYTPICPLCGGKIVPEDKRNSVGAGFDKDLFGGTSAEYFKDENDMYYGDAGLLKDEPQYDTSGASGAKTESYIERLQRDAAYTAPQNVGGAATYNGAASPKFGSSAAYAGSYSARGGSGRQSGKKSSGMGLFFIIVLIILISVASEAISKQPGGLNGFIEGFRQMMHPEAAYTQTPVEEEIYIAEPVPDASRDIIHFAGETVQGYLSEDAGADWEEAMLPQQGIENINAMFMPLSGTDTPISEACAKVCEEYAWVNSDDGNGNATSYMLDMLFDDGTSVRMLFDTGSNASTDIYYKPNYGDCYLYGENSNVRYSFNNTDCAKILKGIYTDAGLVSSDVQK